VNGKKGAGLDAQKADQGLLAGHQAGQTALVNLLRGDVGHFINFSFHKPTFLSSAAGLTGAFLKPG
jgi:hypothetical protein